MSVSGDPQGALVQLAPELLELILSHLRPHDLVSFGKTCHHAYAFIRPSNQILWRTAFLHDFDNPLDAWASLPPTARSDNRHREATWDWFRELRRRLVTFGSVCHSTNADLLVKLESVVTTLLDILETASFSTANDQVSRESLNLAFLNRLFRTARHPERIVHDYHRDIESPSLPLHLLGDLGRPITRSMVGQRDSIPEWASRFHIFYGMTRREEDSIRAKAAARAIVYDWNVTGPDAEFGPLVKDKSGTVNWEALEAITSLMHRVFEAMRKEHRLNTPSGFDHNIPRALSLNPMYPEDWAGITRTWVGTYAFLDYRALVHYNFATNLEYHMDLGAYEEACGDLMQLDLEMCRDSEELCQDSRLQTGLPYCEDLPKLYFSGTSSPGPVGRPYILVRGCVWLAPGARQVRWRFIIHYAGADQWQLEGVQPAGIRSGGIYGLWSHVDHDDHGPMGPFAYFPWEFCEQTTIV